MVLAWSALAFITGVFLGTALVLPHVLVLMSLPLIVLGIRIRGRGRWPILVLGWILLGCWRSPHDSPPDAHSVAFYAGHVVTLTGAVDTEPDIRDRGINYVIAVHQLVLPKSTINVQGRVTIRTPRAQILEYGDGVKVVGRLVVPRNSPHLPWKDILRRQGISAEMRFPRLISTGSSTSGFLTYVFLLRHRLEAGINGWLPEPDAALLIAITLGARTASLGDLAPALIATGLIHLIAISGIKVAMVAGTIHELTKRTGNRFATLGFSLSGLIFYVLLTGATASGIRSALMWALVFVASYLGRGTVALVSLAVVAAIMVAADPLILWDTGFLMSTIGTFAIVALAAPLIRMAWLLPSPVREAFAVTIAAQIGTFPIVLNSFHIVSFVSPFTNAIVLPLLPLLIAMGFLLGASGSVPLVASPVSAVSHALLHVVEAVAQALAHVGPSAGGTASDLFTVVYYVLVCGVAWLTLRRVGWMPERTWHGRKREMVVAGFLAASVLTFSFAHGQETSATQLEWVGSGGAILLRSGGSVALIDGSGNPSRLLQQIAKLLSWQRRSLDVLLITDPRSRNVTGLQALLSHYSVAEVLDVGVQYPSATYSRWRAYLRGAHVPVYALRTGAAFHMGEVNVTALAPDELRSNPADSIAIIRVDLHHESVLISGYADSREQEEAVFKSVPLHANVLVAQTQHLSSDFVRAVHPRIVMRPSIPNGPRSVRLEDGKSVMISSD